MVSANLDADAWMETDAGRAVRCSGEFYRPSPALLCDSLRAAVVAAALLAGLSAQAQPLASVPAADLTYRLETHPGLRVTPTGYRTAMATTFGTIGSSLGGASAIMVLVLASGPGIGSDAAFDVSPAVFVIAGSVGATVGTAVAMRVFGQDERDYRGIIPYPDVRKSDAGPAFVGAAVALLPGIGAALLLRRVAGPSSDPLVFLAVPVAQGIGAAISINRSRARGNS